MSYFGVRLLRRRFVAQGLLDIPNERSSHDRPIPRGGGLLIVVLCLASYGAAYLSGIPNFGWGFFLGALLVAAVSWLDDLYSLPFVLRLLVHFAGAFLLIFDSGYWQTLHLPFFSTDFELGAVGIILTLFWIVYTINAFNFMDGIDGIAGLQAMIAGIGWCVVGVILSNDMLVLFCGVLVSASLGFLIHNWAPARMFMGDVGSAFLGFTFAALPLLAARHLPEKASGFLAVGALFLWFFLFDTIVTLFTRLYQRKAVWTAHREHLYQRLVISGMTHRSVTLLYSVFAAVVSALAILDIAYPGNLGHSILYLIVILSFVLLFLVRRKKILT